MDETYLQSYISCTAAIHVLFIDLFICLHYINLHMTIIKTECTIIFMIQTTSLFL